MKTTKFLRAFALATLLSSAATMIACKDDDEAPAGNEQGTITGTVTDLDTEAPIEGVTVAVSGIDGTVATGSDGKYTVGNVTLENHSVTFSKTGWLSTSVTIAASKFNADKVATVNVTLQNASAKIQGTVTDATNNNAPLSGVIVNVGSAGSDTTGSDGKYAIENLIADSYTATFSKNGYPAVERVIAPGNFVDGVATVDVKMGSPELLRGKTYFELIEADKWYYNEYRGGSNADAYPHWDWACDYMCALSFEGDWEEQREGTTLRIRNDADNQSNPANLDVFDSYVYGSKKITADNKILSLRLRTHDADEAAPAYFGVQVVDLSAAEPAAVKVGENKTHGSGDYTDYEFDLSAYVGKEVVIAIGTYRAATGDYWKQLVLRAIRFAGSKAEGASWLPGTEVAGLENWKLPMEVVRSTMPNPNRTFTGISSGSAKSEVNMTTGYPAVYRSWRESHHIGYEWAFVPLSKDPEVTPSEGYLIKTRGSGTLVNTEVPEAYYYVKFAIAAGSNQLTLKTRNFGSNYTFFKVTAIKEDGTVTHLAPASNIAREALAAENGCWKFKHDAGGRDNPEEYASFVYNLSQFNGSNVVLCFGVYKGEDNGDESKLVFYSVALE